MQTRFWGSLSGPTVGAPLSVAVKKNIVYLYYNLLLTPEEIAPLTLSPRKASSGVDVRAVREGTTREL